MCQVRFSGLFILFYSVLLCSVLFCSVFLFAAGPLGRQSVLKCCATPGEVLLPRTSAALCGGGSGGAADVDFSLRFVLVWQVYDVM